MSPHRNDTIYALSSGKPPSGVAVLRLSGSSCADILSKIVRTEISPRLASLANFYDPITATIIDCGLVLWFPGPHSFTGEDSLEFHCHGSRAVVEKFFDILSKSFKCRLAEPGEFSNRAFLNGKMDLIEAEGLSDLIHAETESQRQLALSQVSGSASASYQKWRRILIEARALLEAELDFADEDDIPGSVTDVAMEKISELVNRLEAAISQAKTGERLRSGVRIVIAGAPNVGKSSLLNYFAQRDVAIVSDVAGTTRDVLEVHMNLDGIAATISDTAGLRESTDKIELAGIDRAYDQLERADVILYLQTHEENANIDDDIGLDKRSIRICNKIDLLTDAEREKIRDRFDYMISIYSDIGLAALLKELEQVVASLVGGEEEIIITRQRHLEGVQRCLDHASAALRPAKSLEMIAEDLRLASDSIARILGLIDIDDMLDVIFREFCIGK